MDSVSGLGFVDLGVVDLDGAVDFYSTVGRLHIAERTASTVYLTGGVEHHWLRLRRASTNGVTRIGFAVDDDAALDDLAARLATAGVDFTDERCLDEDRVERRVRFTDPAGVDVDLFVGMIELPLPPPDTGVALDSLLHVGWRVTEYEAACRFYTDVLGFRVSDSIADRVTFLRCDDGYHHSLVFVRGDGGGPEFDHFCVQARSLDDVMRFRHNALRRGVPLRHDLLRHAPSGSIGVYAVDEARGLAIECCWDHPVVADDHRPRTLPLAPDTIDVWSRELPDPQAFAPSVTAMG